MNVQKIFAGMLGIGLAAALVLPVFMTTMEPVRPPAADDQPVAPAMGGPAPPIELKTLAGEAFSLAALRDKRAALVVFWATW